MIADDDYLANIAEYYKTHSMRDTAKEYRCSFSTIQRAALIHDVSKVGKPRKERKSPESIKKKGGFIPPPPKANWHPTKSAASQHDTYTGRPI